MWWLLFLAARQKSFSCNLSVSHDVAASSTTSGGCGGGGGSGGGGARGSARYMHVDATRLAVMWSSSATQRHPPTCAVGVARGEREVSEARAVNICDAAAASMATASAAVASNAIAAARAPSTTSRVGALEDAQLGRDGGVGVEISVVAVGVGGDCAERFRGGRSLPRSLRHRRRATRAVTEPWWRRAFHDSRWPREETGNRVSATVVSDFRTVHNNLAVSTPARPLGIGARRLLSAHATSKDATGWVCGTRCKITQQ